MLTFSYQHLHCQSQYSLPGNLDFRIIWQPNWCQVELWRHLDLAAFQQAAAPHLCLADDRICHKNKDR